MGVISFHDLQPMCPYKQKSRSLEVSVSTACVYPISSDDSLPQQQQAILEKPVRKSSICLLRGRL